MLSLTIAEFRRVLREFLRYPTEVGVSIVVLVALFYGLFLGTHYMAGPGAQFGERLDSIIVGYVVWTLVLHSFASVAGEMQKDAQVGALEQVFLSAYGPVKVFVCRTIADALVNLMVTLTVLFLILALTGRWLQFSPGALIPVGAIVLGAFGLAFLVGAMALAFKRVQQLVNLGQFVLLFLIMAPFETWQGPVAQLRFLLPLAAGAGLLRDQLARAADLDWAAIGAAYANGAVYALLGLAVFQMMVRNVKRRGTLAWY